MCHWCQTSTALLPHPQKELQPIPHPEEVCHIAELIFFMQNTNLPKVFVQHKITLAVNVPLWTNIKSGAMMGIKYRKHTVFQLHLRISTRSCDCLLFDQVCNHSTLQSKTSREILPCLQGNISYSWNSKSFPTWLGARILEQGKTMIDVIVHTQIQCLLYSRLK